MSKTRISVYSPQYNKLTNKLFSEYVLALKQENVVISPLSIIVFLAIAADATDGKTRKGAKAAAVTAMLAVAGCAPMESPKVVRLDRPFIYAIMHNETGLPVFTGITNHI